MKKILFTIMMMCAITSTVSPVFADDVCVHDWFYDYGESIITDDAEYSDNHYYCLNCGDVKVVREKDRDHMWDYYNSELVGSNDNTHTYKITSKCWSCGKTKTETKTENHKWYSEIVTKEKRKKVSAGNYEMLDVTYKKISNKMHSYDVYYECEDCGKNKTINKKEAHSFDKYRVCENCFFAPAKTITLKKGKTLNLNKNTWVKVVVKRAGYLLIERLDDGYGEWTFYNKSKKKYKDFNEVWGSDCVPVPKGTYYFKTNDSSRIRFTFKKDPSKKNYTKAKAIKLKRNKIVRTIIYRNSPKKTWKRFYKISLPKKQFIKIDYQEYYSFKNPSNSSTNTARVYYADGYLAKVYDAKGKRVEMYNSYTSAYKMPKGTYYIELSGTDDWVPANKGETTGLYLELTWK